MLLKKIKIFMHSNAGIVLSVFNLNQEDYLLFYEGKTVSYFSKIIDLGISENKVLFAIKKDNQYGINLTKSLSSSVMNILKDQFFEKKLKLLTNQNLGKECSRISDMRIWKTEGSRNLYKKKIHSLFLKNMKENDSHDDDFSLNYDYSPLQSPSTDAMPILW